jgi:hypothetical protein
MEPTKTKRTRERLLAALSYRLKALWVFFPGIIFLLLGLFIFLKISQGQDIILQSTNGAKSWITGIYLVLAAIFWVFTTWYTGRLLGYGRKDLYATAPDVVSQFPRLLAFTIFLVLWLAAFQLTEKGHWKGMPWLIAVIDYVIYFLFVLVLEKRLLKEISAAKRKRFIIYRYIVRAMVLTSCVLIIVNWQPNNIGILLYTIPVIQLGFLFLVLVRFPLYKSRESKPKPKARHSWWQRYLVWTFRKPFEGFDIEFERPVFLVYNILAVVAFVCYLLCINNLFFARELTSFPLVLLSFGILLGIINMIALVSHRSRVNISFIIIVLILFLGNFWETHGVRTMPVKGPDREVYAHRQGLDQYLENWISWHKDSFEKDPSAKIPVFFVLADGGASRSGYWVASVLAKLHEGSRYGKDSASSYFMDHLFCLSGASGGSVGNASFLAAYAIQQEQPEIKTDSLCKEFLSNDFLVYPLARLLGPEWIKPAFGWFKFWGDRAYALEYGIENPNEKNSQMAKMMRGSFSELIPDRVNKFPILSINTTRVNDGNPGMVSTIRVDESVFGARTDVITLVPDGSDIRLSTAMILGARFPYVSPGGKLGNSSYFVDGGYFDNSGTGTVHEMLLELAKMQREKKDSAINKYLSRMEFYVIHISNTPYSDSEKDQPKSIHPVVNDLATPLLTLAGSYNSQTNINDARLINYLRQVDDKQESYIKVNLYKDTTQNISMNWVISKQARHKMDLALLQRPSLDSMIARMRDRRTKDLLFDLTDQQHTGK